VTNKNKRPLVVLGLAVMLWLSAIFWLPLITSWLRSRYPDCASDPIEAACSDIFQLLGTTGDLFGAVNALFSGIALFAVAWSIWTDSQARKLSKKPFLIVRLNEDSLTLDDAQFTEPKGLRFVIEAEIENLGEPSLNIQAAAFLDVAGRRFAIALASELLPMGASSSRDAIFRARLDREAIRALIQDFQHIGQHPMLSVSIEYSSLEEVRWETSVKYELETQDVAKLVALVDNRHEEFDRHWQGGVAVGLRATTQPGSWAHRQC
jgi:hypothetical protein